MKIYLKDNKGKKAITLTDRDFISEGGEGKIYAQGDRAYKIYSNPDKVIAQAKIQELAALDHAEIIRPLHAVFDAKQQPIGFIMKRVERGIPLARLFTNDFRSRHGITPEMTLQLVQALQNVLQFIHQQGCLIVDGNEMNYLVDEQTLIKPYFIDVDSYQTPNFAATAIMPTIRDWHCTQFSELSDWFSFAIIACQLFIGIHPFKGRHPDFQKQDLEARMRAHASIFDQGVKLPPSVRDFKHIPSAYRDWFIQLFQRGLREAPPLKAGSQFAIATPKAIDADRIQVKLLADYGEAITRVVSWNGYRAVFTQTALYIGHQRYPLLCADSEVIFSPKFAIPLLAGAVDGQLILQNAISGEPITHDFKAERICVIDNTLYLLQQDRFSSVHINEFQQNILVSPGQVWHVLPNAVSLLDGMLYQNLLGKAHLLIPSQPHSGQMLAIAELDDYRIIDGRCDHGVAEIIGQHSKGRYDRIVLRFNASHTRYHVRLEQDLDVPAINFITLSQGIAISKNTRLEIFFRDPQRTDLKTIALTDRLISTMQLAKDDTQALGFHQQQLYQISLQ